MQYARVAAFASVAYGNVNLGNARDRRGKIRSRSDHSLGKIQRAFALNALESHAGKLLLKFTVRS